MIQRIQTIYLFLAALCSLILCFTILGTSYAPANPDTPAAIVKAFTTTMGGQAVETSLPQWMPGLFLVLATLLRLIAICGYKNRKNQARTCRSAIIADLCAATLTCLQVYNLGKLLPGSTAHPSPTLAMLLISIVFTLLAIRAIRHDERLVRAADRLR